MRLFLGLNHSSDCLHSGNISYLMEPGKVTSLTEDHYDADTSINPKSTSALLKINLMDKVIKSISDKLRIKGIPLYILIIPSPIDVCVKYDWQVEIKKYKNYKRNNLTSLLSKSANRYGIKFLNLFDNFKGENCNNLYFHYGDNHWNDLGQEKAALLMSQKINNASISIIMVFRQTCNLSWFHQVTLVLFFT